MLLAVDVGNTQTVLGVYEGKTLHKMWRIATRPGETADELRIVLIGLFGAEQLSFRDVDGVVLGTVVPEKKQLWTQVGRDAFNVETLAVQHEHLKGLLEVASRGTGADRLANAVAAKKLYGAPVIVVDMGTATNFEVVDAQGVLLGGVIAPGVEASMRSLAKGTALLPAIELSKPGTAIGDNTIDAIRVGCVLGEVDRIDGLVRRIKKQLGMEAPVVATGGLCTNFGQLCESFTAINPELTLQGLRIVYEHFNS